MNITEKDKQSLTMGLLWIQRNITIQRDASGGIGRYASMDGILRAVDAALMELGIVRRWTTRTVDTSQGVMLEVSCTLTHAETGESIEGAFSAPITIPESKGGRQILSGEQAAGKVETYGRRRSLMAALGLVEETTDRTPAAAKLSAAPSIEGRMQRLIELAEQTGGIDEVRGELTARLGNFNAWRGLSDEEFNNLIDEVTKALDVPL
jgi:hypothetical protein